MGVKFSQLWLLVFTLRPFQRKRDLGIANVERVEKRLVMKKSGVIDIEHDFADERKCVGAVSITKDAHVSRDQAAKRIEREMAD